MIRLIPDNNADATADVDKFILLYSKLSDLILLDLAFDTSSHTSRVFSFTVTTYTVLAYNTNLIMQIQLMEACSAIQAKNAS